MHVPYFKVYLFDISIELKPTYVLNALGQFSKGSFQLKMQLDVGNEPTL